MILKKQINGFTLIELLIVITIIAVLLAIALPNFLGVRQRARDAKRKSELTELKKALQLYYSDYNQYPVAGAGATSYLFLGCGVNGVTACVLDNGCEFSAGGGTCATSTIYMKRFPRIDLGLNNPGYQYSRPDVNNFCLSVPLEIGADSDISDSQNRCEAYCVAFNAGTNYVVCND